MAKKYPPPSPPFIRARRHGGRQTPKAIVIHGTVSSDNAGTARNIARWWNGPTSPMSSCHYVVDPAEVIQCVGDHTIAYHCGYNTGSIGVELCDEQAGPASRWEDADSQAILRRAARLVAELCLAYGIDPKRPSIAELKRKGPHGIYGHNDSRLAFGRTTHTDPRDFNWPRFIRMVNEEIASIKGGGKRKKKNTGTLRDKMKPEAYFVGARGPHVKWLARRLREHGYGEFYKNGIDRAFTKGEDQKAVAAFQRDQGWTGKRANGIPDKKTLRRLKGKPGAENEDTKPGPGESVVHIMHASMQFSDTAKQQRKDVKRILKRARKRKVAWITGTEAAGRKNKLDSILKKLCPKYGFRYARGRGDVWIAVNEDFIDGGWGTHWKNVIDGVAGAYSAKGIWAVKFRNKKYGLINVVAGHYLTGGRPGKQPARFSRNTDKNRALAKAIGDYVQKVGKGGALAFYGGDQNIIDRTHDTFFGEPLTSTWDELNKHRKTHVAGNIDVIASYDRDGRVRAKYIRALRDKKFPLHTDHFLVEAGYIIREVKSS